MTGRLHTVVLLIIFLLFSQALCAQSGRWGGGRNNGVFAQPGAGQTGRTITVGGRLAPLRKIDHSLDVSGYIRQILVEVGDRVQPGQDLVSMSRDVVGETFLPVVLESRISGIVSEIHVYESQELGSGTVAVTILDDESFVLKTSLSDRDARAVSRMGEAEVTGITPEGDEFSGRIKNISLEPDYSTGLFSLTMGFADQPGMYIGMVLFVDLAVSSGSGITIEKTAVFRENGKTFVWKLDEENRLKQQEVVTAGENDLTWIVESGLTAEDRYVREVSGVEKEGMESRELIRANMGDDASGGGS